MYFSSDHFAHAVDSVNFVFYVFNEFLKRFYLFLEAGKRREKERERETSM